MFDPQNYEQRYAVAKKNLMENKKISDQNRKMILDFDRFKQSRGVGLAQRAKCLYQMRLLAVRLNKDLTKLTRKDVAELVTRLQTGEVKTKDGNEYSQKAVGEMIKTLKTFMFTFLAEYKEMEIDHSIGKEMKVKIPETKINSNDVLTYEEMLQLIESAKNVQKQALLAVAVVTGARPSEYLRMTIGDVLEDNGKFGFSLQVHETKRENGGSVPRFVDMPIFHTYLRRWLAKHPRREDGNAPLWVCYYKGIGKDRQKEIRPISYVRARKWIKEAFTASDIRKNFDNPYILRHSCITYFWAVMGYDIAKVAKRCGTSVEMIERVYGHLKKEDIVSESRKLFHGISEPTNGKTEFMDCPLCKMRNAKNEKFCSNCGTGLTEEAIAQTRHNQERQTQKLVEETYRKMEKQNLAKLLENKKARDAINVLKTLIKAGVIE